MENSDITYSRPSFPNLNQQLPNQSLESFFKLFHLHFQKQLNQCFSLIFTPTTAFFSLKNKTVKIEKSLHKTVTSVENCKRSFKPNLFLFSVKNKCFYYLLLLYEHNFPNFNFIFQNNFLPATGFYITFCFFYLIT